MLKFLKKIFSAREPATSEQVVFDSLPGWFDEKTKGAFISLADAITEYYSKIRELIQQLNTAVAELESAQIQEPDKIEQRVKVTVLGNRDSYAKNMTLFGKNLLCIFMPKSNLSLSPSLILSISEGA